MFLVYEYREDVARYYLFQKTTMFLVYELSIIHQCCSLFILIRQQASPFRSIIQYFYNGLVVHNGIGSP